MRGLRSKRAKTVVAIFVCTFALLGPILIHGQSSKTTTPSPSATVLDASYANSLGFSKTYESAKRSTATGQEGCSGSVESIYENLGNQTALISESVSCKTSADATASLTSGRKEVHVDPGLKIPTQLGTSAFATASEKPDYLIVWTAGDRVAIVGLDVNIAATSSTASTKASKSITKAQEEVLVNAALKQNSLYG
jgi:hypothetical protein